MEVPFNKRPFAGGEGNCCVDAIKEHSLSENGKYKNNVKPVLKIT